MTTEDSTILGHDKNGVPIRAGTVLRCSIGTLRIVNHARAEVVSGFDRPGGAPVEPGTEIDFYCSQATVWTVIAPKPAGCGYDVALDKADGYGVRCLAGRLFSKTDGRDEGPCPNCAAKLAPQPEAAPQPAAEAEVDTCAGCGAALNRRSDGSQLEMLGNTRCSWDGKWHCVYCFDRLSQCQSHGRESGPGITAAPAPVVDEDGDAWMTATAEWP